MSDTRRLRVPTRLALTVAAITLLGSFALAGCDIGNGFTVDAGVGVGPAVKGHVAKTAALFSCRDQCWADIPYNECSTQRDDCLSSAFSPQAITDCHKMSRTCRKERRRCLRACNKTGNQPAFTRPTTPGQALRVEGHEPGTAAATAVDE